MPVCYSKRRQSLKPERLDRKEPDFQRKMRVAVLIDELRFGGPEKIAIEEVKSFSELGHEATLVVLRKTDSGAFTQLLQGVRTVYVSDLLPWPFRLSLKFPLFRFFSLFHVTYPFLLRIVPMKMHFEAIIAHGTYTIFSGISIAKKQSAELVAYVWDPVTYILQTTYFQSNSRSVFRAIALTVGTVLDTWICRESFKVLVASNRHRNLLVRFTKDEKKLMVLPPGVHIRQTVRSQRQGYVILATAWKRGKDPEYVLDLARRMQDARFILAGGWIDSTLKDSLINRISELGLKGRVEVTGAIDETELLDLYSQAAVFLQVRPDIGFGLPALEAAAQGCAFIIPAGQGVCDLFTDGREGFIVPEKQTDLIVKHIQELSSNPEIAYSMGLRAQNVARAFSWKCNAQHLSSIVLET